MDNLAATPADVPEAIQRRQLAHLFKAGVAERLGLALTAAATAAE